MENFLLILGSLVAGFGIGWLTSLSRSGILATIIPALLTAAVSAISVVRALKSSDAGGSTENTGKPDILILAPLIAGVALGSTAGAFAIANAWFAPRPAAYIALSNEISDPALKALKKRYLNGLVPILTAQETIRPPLENGTMPDNDKSMQCLSAIDIIHRVSPINESIIEELKLVVNDNEELKSIVEKTPPDKLRDAIQAYCQ